MTVLGLPLSMFLVFVATIVAGSLGAVHFLIVHMIMKRPFPDEMAPLPEREPAAPSAGPVKGGRGPEGGAR